MMIYEPTQDQKQKQQHKKLKLNEATKHFVDSLVSTGPINVQHFFIFISSFSTSISPKTDK